MIIEVMESTKFDPFLTIEEATCLTDLEEQASLLRTAIEYMVSHCDSQSAEVEYAIGYAWYFYPCDSTTRDEQIEQHLKNALQIDPLHRFAKLYLAHYYFDNKQFSTALSLLSYFSPTEFNDVYGQEWRDAKNAELILCCKIYLCDIDGIKNAVRQLCKSLTKSEPDMNPEPIELIEVLHILMNKQV